MDMKFDEITKGIKDRPIEGIDAVTYAAVRLHLYSNYCLRLNCVDAARNSVDLQVAVKDPDLLHAGLQPRAKT